MAIGVVEAIYKLKDFLGGGGSMEKAQGKTKITGKTRGILS